MSSRAARSRAARASLLWNSLPSKKPQGQQCSHGNGWPQTSLINSAVSTPAIKRAASCTPRASTFSTWQPTHRWKMTAFKRWEQKREQRGDGAEELRGLCDTWACTLLRDFSLSGILLTTEFHKGAYTLRSLEVHCHPHHSWCMYHDNQYLLRAKKHIATIHFHATSSLARSMIHHSNKASVKTELNFPSTVES